MADVHLNVPVPADMWTDATTALSIPAGARWGFEAVGAPVEAFETDSADEPSAGKRGQSIFPGSPARRADRLPWTREAGRYLWFRGAGSDAVVVAAPG